jgi:hypothetical protein
MSTISNLSAPREQFRQRDDDFTLDQTGIGANFTPLELSDGPGLVVYEYFVGEPVAIGTATADMDWNHPAHTGEPSPPPQTAGVESSSDSVYRSSRTTVERFRDLQDLQRSLSDAEARAVAAGIAPAAPDAGARNLSKVQYDFLHPPGEFQRIL